MIFHKRLFRKLNPTLSCTTASPKLAQIILSGLNAASLRKIYVKASDTSFVFAGANISQEIYHFAVNLPVNLLTFD